MAGEFGIGRWERFVSLGRAVGSWPVSRGLETMRSGAGGVLMDRDVVRVCGADASSYLQGQISQDVESVAVGESAWSLILQPQGRIDAWFRLTRLGPDEFLLDVDAGHGAGLVERLERFRLRVDVEVEGLLGWRMLAIRGPQANSADAGLTDVSAEDSIRSAATTGALAAAGAAEAADQSDYEGRGGHGSASTGPEVRATVDWPGYEGVDLLFSGPEHGLAVWPGGLSEADRADLEVLRIRAGWPVMGAEIGPRTIPAELGPGLISKSVSFTKGCYTGQELVARIDSRGGNVPRPLRLIEIADAGDAGDLVPGAAVTVDGETVGEVTSAAFDPATDLTVALGPVHRRVEPPAAVAVAGRDATVQALPTPD